MDNNSTTSNCAPLNGEAREQNDSGSAQQTVATRTQTSEKAEELPRMLLDEKKYVVGLRDSELRRTVSDDDLFGLALSGGGIRSATFSLGVLQALAQRGWIRRIDYLSTVSGGGYIGCWLSACIFHMHEKLSGNSDSSTNPVTEVEKLIAPTTRENDAEPTEIRFLREYSSYLTPRLGLLSGDMLALFAGYARNLCLTLFLASISIFFIIAYLHAAIATVAYIVFSSEPQNVSTFAGFAALFLFALTADPFAFLMTLQGFDLSNLERHAGQKDAPFSIERLRQIQNHTELIILLPLFLSFLNGSIWFALSGNFVGPWVLGTVITITAFMMLLFIAWGTKDAYSAVEIAKTIDSKNIDAYTIEDMKKIVDDARKKARQNFNKLLNDLGLKIFIAVIFFYGALYIIVFVLSNISFERNEEGIVQVAVYGPLIAAAGCWVFYIIFMMVVGKSYSEFTREWFSRLLGRLAQIAALWLFASEVIIHARPVWWWAEIKLMQVTQANHYVIGFAIAFVGILFVFGWNNSAQRSPGSFSKIDARRLLLPLMSWSVIVVVILAFTAIYQTTIHAAVRAFAPQNHVSHYMFKSYSEIFHHNIFDFASIFSEPGAVLLLSIIFLLILWFVTWALFRLIDVNTFSMQGIYRNRLVRCYMGAANHAKRGPHPYAGFDPKDDFELAELAEQRPYLLINAALNLTHGQSLAWQQRKAASFVFSPCRCGYWLESTVVSRQDQVKGGYVKTEDFARERQGVDGSTRKGVMVGTAMATSGAAVNSQMGYASRGSRAFLLTLLNMRLGRWFPNPTWEPKSANSSRKDHWKRHSPDYSARYFLRELCGFTNERAMWILLSDGGHFENLGIYELVSRRCRRIICVDGGADPQRAFRDLGNAVQKCRVDFGVDIRIDTRPLSIDPVDGRSENGFSIGTIFYPVTDDSPPFKGTLIYIKPSIPKAWDLLPSDILSYRARHPEFPHEPTRDQWFTETQFESYRELGYLIGLKAFQDAWLT